uniref:Uncharacterized protein n=1 Tax=Setaria italica TaxID=4555 RepID=A0A0Q3TXY8_SETIT
MPGIIPGLERILCNRIRAQLSHTRSSRVPCSH